jgi:aspartyl-tRNA(Asn)/glutamyl-tRNA(Gln) amidotransferase subunit C
MARIKKSDVEKMAQLSRLNLTDTEKEKFASQFSDILGYVEELSEIDDKSIEPIDHITGKSNVLREDKITTKSDREEILKNAPAQENGFIKVKAVFNGSK